MKKITWQRSCESRCLLVAVLCGLHHAVLGANSALLVIEIDKEPGRAKAMVLQEAVNFVGSIDFFQDNSCCSTSVKNGKVPEEVGK